MITLSQALQKPQGFLRRLLSVPIFWKVLGIGLVVAALFGSVTLWQQRTLTLKILHQSLALRSFELARSLSIQLERPLLTDNRIYIKELLKEYTTTTPDIRYILVRDIEGKIIAHTFPVNVPLSLQPLVEVPAEQEGLMREFTSEDGLLFDTIYPIMQNQAGQVEIALNDQSITGQASFLSRALFWTLLLCMTLGIALAWGLTHLMTRPLLDLDQAARQLGQGKFTGKTEIYYDDEIGRLALTFNEMAENLEKYRLELTEKEKTRLFLLEKLVRTQEDERRAISRELHDQMGQSLSGVLFTLQSGIETPEQLIILENKLRGLIGEVQKLAWNMRPSILDDYGLDSSLARYTDDRAKQLGLPIDYQYMGPEGRPRLPGSVETALYRITQEALTNIARHAQATRVSVVVLHMLDNVTLLVEDNGKGFDTAIMNQDGLHSLGLTGIKERTGLLGGTCTIESTIGQGTVVRIQIPLQEIPV